MEMNITHLFAALHTAGIRANLLNNYNPANVTQKASVERQKVSFNLDTAYYPIPMYEISSAANLNLSFVLHGTAIDTEHNVEYPGVVQFKCISIVKNNKLFKQTLDICPDDLDKLDDLGIDHTNGVIDLTKYSLELTVDNEDDDSFAEAIVGQYLYNVFRHKNKRQPAAPLSENAAWLKQNGYDEANKVWFPIIEHHEVRVDNTNCDRLGWVVENRKGIPSYDAIQEKIAAGKKLTDLEAKITRIAGIATKDYAPQINTVKYALYSKNAAHAFEKDVVVNGETFHVSVSI